MYKILFITLIVLSVSIRAHPEAETGVAQLNADTVDLTAAKPAATQPASTKPAVKPAAKPAAKPIGGAPIVGKPQPAVKPNSSQTKVAPRTGFNAKTANVKTRKCHNRFDYGGFQVDLDCVACGNGTHEKNGKCVSNADGCTKKVLVARTNKAKVTTNGNCVKCNTFMWTTVSAVQGDYCVNRWWMWVIIVMSAIVGLALLVSAITFFTCCDDMCSKKQPSKSSKGKGGEVDVHNKKPTDKKPTDKKKSSGGCCGGDEKKSKKEESYDKGYSKPGFCDCMCLANSCGGCFGACGCTCSKCCKKQSSHVSGYGLGDRY